jgi:hypothetical protein
LYRSTRKVLKKIAKTIGPGKIITRILPNQIRAKTDHIIGEYYTRFCPGGSTIDQIFVVRQLAEKYLEYGKEILQLIIDFKQAFGLAWLDGLWHLLAHSMLPKIQKYK